MVWMRAGTDWVRPPADNRAALRGQCRSMMSSAAKRREEYDEEEKGANEESDKGLWGECHREGQGSSEKWFI